MNLTVRRVEVYASPDEANERGYAGRQSFEQGDAVPLRIAGMDLGSVAVAALLP